MIDWTPGAIAISIGPIDVHWYGVMYALGLAATYWVVHREVVRRGLDPGLLVNGLIVVAAAALVGGRLYHVIDQWALYRDNLAAIVLPPYSGLGAYGGIATGFVAGVAFALWKRQRLAPWADAAAIGILTMQAVGRWGNFFNQELYGPPTTLPWGIAIDCAHRTPTLACPPLGTTPPDAYFHPLFLYESLSGAIGAIVLSWAGRRARWIRDGDVVLLFLAWYGTTRFLLEPLRTNNWLFFGVPTASIISGLMVVGALAALAWRHRPGAGGPEPVPEVAGQAPGVERVPEVAGQAPGVEQVADAGEAPGVQPVADAGEAPSSGPGTSIPPEP